MVSQTGQGVESMRPHVVVKLRVGFVKYWDLKVDLAKVVGCRFGCVFVLCTDR